jgi:pimeloyl-ACP methyl ester carboxylesterase
MTNAQQFPFDYDLEDGSTDTFIGHYYPAHPSRKGILQVLLHGNSYDHRYWDAGRHNGVDYSYVRYMTARGFDILSVDLPGTGLSSRPHGDNVALASVAKGLASGLANLRAGQSHISDSFDRIALVGHSLGAVLSVYTQGRWAPADRVVATGTGYFPDRGPSPFGPGVREQAMSEHYAYLTAEVRRKVFYHLPSADPDVIDFDNNVLRTMLPRRLWSDALLARDDPDTSGVKRVLCPIYFQLGEYDPIMPSTYATAEAEYWRQQAPHATDVRIDRLDGVGHAFNLHLNHEDGWKAIDHFLTS